MNQNIDYELLQEIMRSMEKNRGEQTVIATLITAYIIVIRTNIEKKKFDFSEQIEELRTGNETSEEKDLINNLIVLNNTIDSKNIDDESSMCEFVFTAISRIKMIMAHYKNSIEKGSKEKNK